MLGVSAFTSVAPLGGAIASASYTNDPTPDLRVTLDSSAASGDALQVLDAGRPVIASRALTATDLARGYVDLTLPPLADGWHPLQVSLSDPAGASLETPSLFGIAVATRPPSAPLLNAWSQGGVAHTLSGDSLAAPSGDFQLIVTESDAPPPPQGSPGHSPFGGPAILGGQVELFDAGHEIASGAIGYGGTVTLDLPDLGPGEHHLSLVATDRAGNSSAATSIELQGLATSSSADQAEGAMAAVLRVSSDASQAAHALAAQIDAALAANAAPSVVLQPLLQAAEATTDVATLTYQFFTGATPTSAGMDYLLSPNGGNPNNLNAAYYQGFSLEDRYINFAVNLAVGGDQAAAFRMAYGALTMAQATASAYTAIFGVAPSGELVHQLLSAPVADNGAVTRGDYFALAAHDTTDGLGAKAAMVGWLLAEAAKADAGPYVHANDALLSEVALHQQDFGVSLLGHTSPLFDSVG